MRESPTIFTKQTRGATSLRQQALAMFLAGKSTNDVVTALGIRRSTAATYLGIAREMHAERPKIIAMIEAGESAAAIVRALRVSIKHVQRIMDELEARDTDSTDSLLD